MSTGLFLDIGAGGTSFVKLYRGFNPSHNFVYLCGEPGYRDPRNKKKLLCNSRTRKIHRVCATYGDFNLPDNSLSAVSLNAFHAMCWPYGIEMELKRCLQPGGVFFSAHPIALHPNLDPEHFDEVYFGHRSNFSKCTRLELQFRQFSDGYRWVIPFTILFGTKRTPKIYYPASDTIQDRMTHGMTRNSVGYIYSGLFTLPTLRIWVRR